MFIKIKQALNGELQPFVSNQVNTIQLAVSWLYPIKLPFKWINIMVSITPLSFCIYGSSTCFSYSLKPHTPLSITKQTNIESLSQQPRIIFPFSYITFFSLIFTSIINVLCVENVESASKYSTVMQQKVDEMGQF